jgi:hypothetical protein
VFTIFFALIGCTLSVKGFSEVVRFPIVYKLKQNEIYVSVIDRVIALYFVILFIYFVLLLCYFILFIFFF